MDAGAWVALADHSDALHARAQAFYPEALAGYRTLVTTGLVLGESHMLLRRTFSTDVLLRWLSDLLTSPKVLVVWETSQLVERGLVYLARYADHRFSLADAVSFAVMEGTQIDECFGFDRHFAIAGFTLLPRLGRGR